MRFAAGEGLQTIAIPILNDGLQEGHETFAVALANPTAGAALGSLAVVTLAIADNDPGPHFVNVSPYIPENDREVVLFVERGNDVNLEPFTVDYATADGTARAGQDCEATSGTLSFAQGEPSKTITVRILNDARREETEYFGVRLSNPTGGVQPAIHAVYATISIADNDPGHQCRRLHSDQLPRGTG